MGGFASNLHHSSVLHVELTTIIIAMEVSVKKGWNTISIESYLQVTVMAFMNKDIVLWDLRNRWSNNILDLNMI